VLRNFISTDTITTSAPQSNTFGICRLPVENNYWRD